MYSLNTCQILLLLSPLWYFDVQGFLLGVFMILQTVSCLWSLYYQQSFPKIICSQVLPVRYSIIFHHSPFQHCTSWFNYTTFTCLWSLDHFSDSGVHILARLKMFVLPQLSGAFLYCLLNHLLMSKWLFFHVHTAAHFFSVLLDKVGEHLNILHI